MRKIELYVMAKYQNLQDQARNFINFTYFYIFACLIACAQYKTDIIIQSSFTYHSFFFGLFNFCVQLNIPVCEVYKVL